MTSQLIATYANGVFTPKEPLDLPENLQIGLMLIPLKEAESTEAPAGSAEAWLAYIQHCQHSEFNSGERPPTREELYEGR